MKGFRLFLEGSLPALDYLSPSGNVIARLLLADRRPSRKKVEPPSPLQRGLLWPLQIHGTTILDFKAVPLFPDRPEGDGIFIDRQGGRGMLRFADCFPVIFSGRRPFPWVMALHCGFKGTVKGIIDKSLEYLDKRGIGVDDFDGTWVGPGIGPCCFDRHRNDPWTRRGLALFDRKAAIELGDTVHFDIAAFLQKRLLEAGVARERLFVTPWCTHCRKDLFYSYRGGDEKARMCLFFAPPGSPLFA